MFSALAGVLCLLWEGRLHCRNVSHKKFIPEAFEKLKWKLPEVRKLISSEHWLKPSCCCTDVALCFKRNSIFLDASKLYSLTWIRRQLDARGSLKCRSKVRFDRKLLSLAINTCRGLNMIMKFMSQWRQLFCNIFAVDEACSVLWTFSSTSSMKISPVLII